jgi:hypothetical protein
MYLLFRGFPSFHSGEHKVFIGLNRKTRTLVSVYKGPDWESDSHKHWEAWQAFEQKQVSIKCGALR